MSLKWEKQMYLHEVMKKEKAMPLNKMGGMRNLTRNLLSTVQNPTYLSKGMSAMGPK